MQLKSVDAMNGTSISDRSRESRGLVKRGGLAGRNPPGSRREERRRSPPLAGTNEFRFAMRGGRSKVAPRLHIFCVVVLQKDEALFLLVYWFWRRKDGWLC